MIFRFDNKAKLIQKRRFVLVLFLVSGCFMWSGCPGQKGPPDTGTHVLKSGPVVITLADFMGELELKKTAYPYNIKDNPSEYNEMVMDLVRTLMDETLLLRLAEEKQIIVTQEEINAAENRLKEDYPQDSFEQMLLQNAIPYLLWKKRFERQLLMDKVLEIELFSRVTVTAHEIDLFYQQQAGEDITENELIEKLKSQKVQQQYDDWIEHLKTLYPVEINRELLENNLLIGLTQ